MMRPMLAALLALIALLAACAPAAEEPTLLVSLVADGRERTFSYQTPVTVEQFLQDSDITLTELDTVNPLPYTQITDGMRVTVVRVLEERYCEEEAVPFQRRTIPNEGLQPGEERLGQSGQNGEMEICYRVQTRDGVPHDPVEISRTIITSPRDEVIYVGPSGQLDPVNVNGTIAYISNGNAWIMNDTSTTKRPLTTSGDVDGHVFRLSPDGRQLLFTRRAFNNSGDASTFNTLWLIPDTTIDAEPMELLPNNILYADWVPGSANTISYSTAEARNTPPGWQALNDFWIMRLDPRTGEPLNVREVVEESSGGLYGWWGTDYQWSNSGDALAWIRADSMGTVNVDTGEHLPLLTYPVYNTFQAWSWRATVSWSPDDDLLLTTVHGLPIGSEPAETSPAFHVAVTDTRGTFEAPIAQNAGIWAAPKYSPEINADGAEFPLGYVAYLRCRDFPNCISDSAQYDLYLADRDGSNPRRLYPPDGQSGLTQREFVWSPDGRQIAFLYQGNLWVIDIFSQVASQLTLDGGASSPVWAR